MGLALSLAPPWRGAGSNRRETFMVGPQRKRKPRLAPGRPAGVLRRARELTKRVLLIETQTTILDLSGAIDSGHHSSTNYMHGYFGLFSGNPDNIDGSASDIVFYPSPGGLVWALGKLGFPHVRILQPPPGAYQQLATGKRIMIEARL